MKEYRGNTGIQIGSYSASATLNYDSLNYEEPVMPQLQWEIANLSIPGDSNNDGKVDIIDLVTIIDYIVSDTPVDSMRNADANGDSEIDIMDLVWIIDLIVGS